MHDTLMESTEHVVESSDDHLFSGKAPCKRKACTSVSGSRISGGSIEQTVDLATIYEFTDLITAHPSILELDQNYVRNQTTSEEKLPLGGHMVIMDSTESCMSTERKAGDCGPGESRNSKVMWSRGSKAFACPYFRHDPIRHIECLSRKVNRIQDVKQHLARRHYLAQTESQATGDNIEGVSPSAQDSLKVRVDRRLPPEGQWYTIWDILFKRMGPDLGPYLGNTEEEIIGITREIYRRRSREAVSRFLTQEGLPASRIGLFESLMMGLLDGLRDCSNEQESDSELRKLPENSLNQTFDSHPMHTRAPFNDDNSPKATDKGEDQETIISRPQGESPSVKTDSLVLHRLPGLADDWVSITKSSALTLYNESRGDEMPTPLRSPVLGCLEETDCTFNESPSNSTWYSPLASTAATPESRLYSEPPFVPSKKPKLDESYQWKCHECNFTYSSSSGKVCQNYPCQHHYCSGCFVFDVAELAEDIPSS